MVARKSKAKPKARKDPLQDYRQKRDFSRTPEPAPAREASLGGEFVVQKHAARRLHYDLRLELDGVLKSWAVPNGPSLVANNKRLAVETEDHPMQYLDFEGNIPEGEYGGGAMIVWDRGRWVPEGDPHFGLNKGHLAFALEGRRLKGRWHLVRMKPRRGGGKRPEWLFIKVDDAFARPAGQGDITEEETTSFLSGRTTDELAALGDVRSDHAARAAVAAVRDHALPDIAAVRGAKKGLLPVFLAPSLAGLCERPPSGPKWAHEIKHDGYRIGARVDGGKIKLLTRTGLDWTSRFSSIVKALAGLGLASAYIDGEVVVEDAAGISNFNSLQADLSSGRQDRMRLYVFDLLYCEGFDLTRATLLDRKTLLADIVGGLPAHSLIRFSEHLIDHDGPTILDHTCRLGLEGIVSKRVDLPYRAGRGEHWLKSKCMLREAFVIVGYVPSTAAPGTVGALLLGYYGGGKLHYAGRVGTGYSGAESKALRDKLEAIHSTKSAFSKPLPAGAEKGVRWAKPQLVCEVEFRGWTEEVLIRQSSYKGLREDMAAKDVTLETGPPKTRAAPKPDLAGVRLTHPERILWADAGITKQGLAEFYAEIADWILPHLVNRPLSLLRSPAGVGEKGFFAKHPWHGLGDAVRRVDTGDDQPMLAIDDLAGLIGMVQAGVVEIHPWGSTVDRLEEPDRLIFDLDPGEDVPWSAVIEAALETRERLRKVGLASFVKTSGGKGLHVVVPIVPRVGWEEAKAFTASIAEAMSKDDPKRYVATMSKRARQGRVFVDYFRNGRGATAVAPYSTRARPEASVSTPLAWEELSLGVRADQFTIDNLRQRLDFFSGEPWPDFFALRQQLPRI